MTYDGRWEALIPVPAGVTVSATNTGGGPTAVTITPGTYTPTQLVAQLLAQLTATRPPSSGSWTATLSTGASGTGKTAIGCTGTWSLAWTSTTLRDLLGHVGDYASVTGTKTGTKQMRGLWLPDAVLQLDGDPGRAPLVTDHRASISPTLQTYTLVGNAGYRHTGLMYPNVPRAKVWESQAAIANASWETFLRDVQFGLGSISWFAPGTAVQIYDHNAQLLGADANGGAGLATGWTFPDVHTIEAKKSQGQWLGLFAIPVGQLVSSG